MRRRTTKKYMKGWGALYGDGEIIPKVSSKPKKEKQDVPTEAHDQIRLVVWMTKTFEGSDIRFTASANGEIRDSITGAKLKRMGVSAGWVDMEIPEPRKPYHGLYIELKRVSGGVISPAQRSWHEYLTRKKYFVGVARGFEEAKEMIESYLLLPKWEQL